MTAVAIAAVGLLPASTALVAPLSAPTAGQRDAERRDQAHRK